MQRRRPQSARRRSPNPRAFRSRATIRTMSTLIWTGA